MTLKNTEVSIGVLLVFYLFHVFGCEVQHSRNSPLHVFANLDIGCQVVYHQVLEVREFGVFVRLFRQLHDMRLYATEIHSQSDGRRRRDEVVYAKRKAASDCDTYARHARLLILKDFFCFFAIQPK